MFPAVKHKTILKTRRIPRTIVEEDHKWTKPTVSTWKGHWMSSKVSSRLKAIVQNQTVYNSTAFRNTLTKQIWWLGPSRQDATCFRLLPFYLSMFALRCFGLCPRFHLDSQISFLVFSFPSLSFLACFFSMEGPSHWFTAITQHQQWPKICLVGPVRNLWDLTYRLQTNACNPSDSQARMLPCDGHFIIHDLRIPIHQPLGCTVPCINAVSWWYISGFEPQPPFPVHYVYRSSFAECWHAAEERSEEAMRQREALHAVLSQDAQVPGSPGIFHFWGDFWPIATASHSYEEQT